MLIARLKLAWSFGASRVKVLNDSLLVVNEINGEYAKDIKMSLYLARVKHLQSQFKEFLVQHLPQSENSDVDVLRNLRSTIDSEYKQTILVEIFSHPSILDVKDICSMDQTNTDWMDSILLYIQNKTLPSNKLEARRVQRVTSNYTVLGRQL